MIKSKLSLIFVIFIVISYAGIEAASGIRVGSRVECNWKNKGKYYKGKVTSITGYDIYVTYDDGDVEKTTTSKCKCIASCNAPGSAFRKNDKVSCNWKGKGKYYHGTITNADGDKVSVRYDDGDTEKNIPQSRCKKLKKAHIRIHITRKDGGYFQTINVKIRNPNNISGITWKRWDNSSGRWRASRYNGKSKIKITRKDRSYKVYIEAVKGKSKIKSNTVTIPAKEQEDDDEN